MSLKTDAQQAFLAYLIAELSKLLQAEDAGLSAERQTTTGVRGYGQGSRGANGETFTGKQNLHLPRPGQPLHTVTVDGVTLALGNSPRRGSDPPRRATGYFGYVKRAVEDDYPYQPALSLSVHQEPDEHELPAWLALPVGQLAFDFAWFQQTGEIRFTLIPEGYGFPFDARVRAVVQSNRFDPALPPVKWQDLNAAFSGHYPQKRAYSACLDDSGVYHASWPHWEGDDPFGDTNTPPAMSYTFTPTAPAVTVQLPDGRVISRDAITGPPVTVRYEAETYQTYLYAYRYRYSKEGLFTEEIEIYNPTTDEYVRTRESHNRTQYASVIENDLWQYESSSGGFYEQFTAYARDFNTYYQGEGNYNVQYGHEFVYFKDLGNIGYADSPGAVTGTASVRLENGGINGTHTLVEGPGETYRPPNAHPYFLRGYTFADEPVINEISGPAFPVLMLTEQQKKSIIPYYDEWPWPPTEQSRNEVARLNPYIYDVQGQLGGHVGKLANPTGKLGVVSEWFGLTWQSLEYAADAFYAELPNAEGVLEEHLLGVAIVKVDEVYTVMVSVDKVPVGEWSLWDFFPTATEHVLTFLSGDTWDGSLLPSYHFAAPSWPFKTGVGYLEPFRARVRSKQDKAGQMFAPAAALCPVTLYLDEPPPVDP